MADSVFGRLNPKQGQQFYVLVEMQQHLFMR